MHHTGRLYAERDATCPEESVDAEMTCRERYARQLEDVRDQRDSGMYSLIKFIGFVFGLYSQFDWNSTFREGAALWENTFKEYSFREGGFICGS